MNMTFEDEARENAIPIYRILAGLQGMLGLGLLVCGILAVANKDVNDFGMPYFLGGFIVGILTLITSAISTCICLKAPDVYNEEKKKEIGCAMRGQYILSIFTMMGCIVGCFSAGMGGFGSSSRFDKEEEDDDGIKKMLAILILVGCIVAIFVSFFSYIIVYSYGPYFGVVIQSARRYGRIVIMNTGETTMPSECNTTTFQTTTRTNNEQIRQLETQNRLLQQQVKLQRQLQQQQQQQTQYSGGFYPPPPPPSYSTSACPPSRAPPRYNDVK